MALTAKQQRFAEHFAQHHDGPAAYRAAFAVQPGTKARSVSTAASKLLATPEIAQTIENLRSAAPETAAVTFGIAEARDWWLDIARADPNELIGLRIGACRHCWGEGGEYHWKEPEYWAAVREAEKAELPLPDMAGGFGYKATNAPNPECWKCEGEGMQRVVARDTSKLTAAGKLLYGGVKHTREGPQILIADRQKALENACRIIGAYTDNVKLDGSIKAMANVIKLEASDPQAAAEAYKALMAATSAT